MFDIDLLFVASACAVVVLVMVVLGRVIYRAITAPRLQGSARSARRRATAATVLGVWAAAFALVGVGVVLGLASIAALLFPAPRVAEPLPDRMAAEARP